jgi:hypothetical protein
MRLLDRAFIAAGIASLSVLIAVSSCDDKTKTERPTKDALESTMEKEQWKVTYSSDDRTYPLDGYVFSFSEDKSIEARKNNIIVSGVWSTFEASKGLKLNLEFPSNQQHFEVLTDDWVVVEQTEGQITLESINDGGTGGKLTFERV